MAEVNGATSAGINKDQPASGSGSGNPGNAVGGNASGAGGQDEPKWLSHIPEDQREEARRGYMLNSDYTKKTQAMSERERQWAEKETQLAQFQDWWKSFEPTYRLIADEKNWPKVQALLTGNQSYGEGARQQHQAQTQQDDAFRDWDLLPPREQAAKIAEYVQTNAINSQLNALKQEFNQALASREAFYKNYMNILTEGFSRKFENPELSLPDYLSKALEFSHGKIDPLKMAYAEITRDSSTKKQQESWEKAGYERAKLEFEQRAQANGANSGSFIPTFKQQALSADQIKEQVRQQSISKGIPWSSS